MTSKLTRERIEQYANDPRMCNINDEIRQMARMALAAMDSEPVAEVLSNRPGNDTSTIDRALPVGTQLYRHAQPAPVVSADLLHTAASAIEDLLTTKGRMGAYVWFDLPFRLRSAANAQPAPVVPACTCPSGDGSLRWPCPVHPGNSPAIPEGYKLVPTELTSEMVKAFRSFCEAYDVDLIAGYKAMLAAAPQEVK